jgi:hypothetical protein
MKNILLIGAFVLLLISCEKETLVLNDYSTNTFTKVVIIDSLFKDSMTLSLFNGSGVKYLNFDLNGVSTNENEGYYNIYGQLEVVNLLGNHMSSTFAFNYFPPNYNSGQSNLSGNFLWWNDYIGTNHYSNQNLDNIFYSMNNYQFHISGDYQLDSVTFIPSVNSSCDSLFGSPTIARFYPK